MASEKILIVGQSHTEAVTAALRTRKEDVTVVNLNARDRQVSLLEKLRTGGYVPDPSSFGLVVSMIGGNYHNTFGLIENPIKFEFTQPGEQDFHPTEGRQLITYGLIHHFFSDSMRRGFLRNIKALSELAPRPILHVSAPPPIQDGDHIMNNPGSYFADKRHLGVTPSSLRLKLYTLHEKILSEFCSEEGIRFLPPPPDAVTPEGFLEPRFWRRNDPTHANALYGGLVLDQILGALQK